MRAGAPDRSLTANAGLAAVTELCGRLGVIEALDAAVGPVKQRDRGFGAGELLTRKLGPRRARGSEPWPVRWQGVRDGAGCPAGNGRGAGSAAAPMLREIRACGYRPDGKAASGGLMVMVIVQPGWSFCSWRSRYFCCSSGEFRRV